jgi:hypothetical protein
MVRSTLFNDTRFMSKLNDDPDPEDDQGDSGGGINDDLGTASENGDGDAV